MEQKKHFFCITNGYPGLSDKQTGWLEAPSLQGHSELCEYSRATRERYKNRCFRIHPKGTMRKQTPLAKQEPSNTCQTTNQQAMIATQNLAYHSPPPSMQWLTTAIVNTPHPACHCHSPCPLTNSLPHPTPYAISHHRSDYYSTVP